MSPLFRKCEKNLLSVLLVLVASLRLKMKVKSNRNWRGKPTVRKKSSELAAPGTRRLLIMTYFSTIYKLSLVAAVCFVQGNFECFRSIIIMYQPDYLIAYNHLFPLSNWMLFFCFVTDIKLHYPVICPFLTMFTNVCWLNTCPSYSWGQPLSGVGMLVCARENRSRRRSDCGCGPGKISAPRQYRCTQSDPKGSIWHQAWENLLCNWWVQGNMVNRTLKCLFKPAYFYAVFTGYDYSLFHNSACSCGFCFTKVCTKVNICYKICPQIQRAPSATSLWTLPGAQSRSPHVRPTHSCRTPPPSNGQRHSQILKGVPTTCKLIGFQLPVWAPIKSWPSLGSCELPQLLKSSVVTGDVTHLFH